MDHQQMYQYFEVPRSRSSPEENKSRSRSVIIPFKPRICCECGVEECPYCGRSPSPPSKKKGFDPEFIEREYKNLSKSTTHEDFRSYGSKKDLEVLFGFPAGRPNPDEVYFDRSPNNKRSKDKRTYSNIERYKEASPIMKRGLQSHISDILGYEDSTESVEEESPNKKEKDIWAQGLPPGIYRSLSSKSPASMSPQPQAKQKQLVPWQRISKQDLEKARNQKKKQKQYRRGDSPQKKKNTRAKSFIEVLDSGETRGNEVQQQDAKWKNKDLTQTAIAQFQDKVKQASMLLRKSNSEAPMNRDSNQEYSTAYKSMNEFSVQTYVDNDYMSFNKMGERDERAALIERIAAKEKEKEQNVKSPMRFQKGEEQKVNSEIRTRTPEEQEEYAPVQGDSLIMDIFKRYGNQNRGGSVKERQSKTVSNTSSKRGSSVFNEPVSSQNQVNMNMSATDLKNTFGNEKLTKSEIISQEIDRILKKDSFNSNNDEKGAPKSKSSILSQQVSMLREISQTLLKRGNSEAEFQSQDSQGNHSSASEQGYYPGTGASQREQGYFGDLRKTLKSAESHSYHPSQQSQQSNSEEDDLVEQRSASIKGGSRKSLGKESSVVEFIPADELSLKNVNPFMNTRPVSQQGETQEYPSERQIPSVQRSIERLKSQDQVASRSSIADSQPGKRNSGVGSFDNLSQNSESKRSYKVESQSGSNTRTYQLQKEATLEEERKNFAEPSVQNKSESDQAESSVIINKTLRSFDFRRQLSQEVPFEGNPILRKAMSLEVSQVFTDGTDSVKDSKPAQRPSRKDNIPSDKMDYQDKQRPLPQLPIEGNFSESRKEIASKISRNPSADYDQQERSSVSQGSVPKNQQDAKKTTPPLYKSLEQSKSKRTDSFEEPPIKKFSSFDETVIPNTSDEKVGGNFYENTQIRKDIASKISRNPTVEYYQPESNSIIQGSVSEIQGGKTVISPLSQSGNQKKSDVVEETQIRKSPSIESFDNNSQIRKELASKIGRNTPPVQSFSDVSSQAEQGSNPAIQGSFSKNQDGKKTAPSVSQALQQKKSGRFEEPQIRKSPSINETNIPKASSQEIDRHNEEESFDNNSQIRKELASKMRRNIPPAQSSSDVSSPAESGQQGSNLITQGSFSKKTTPPLSQSQGNPNKTDVIEESQIKKSSSFDETIPKTEKDDRVEETFHDNSQIRRELASKMRRNTPPAQSSSDVSSPAESGREENKDSLPKKHDEKKVVSPLSQSSQQGNQKKSGDASEEAQIRKSSSQDETIIPKEASENPSAEYYQPESKILTQGTFPKKSDVSEEAQIRKSSSIDQINASKAVPIEKERYDEGNFSQNPQSRKEIASKMSRNPTVEYDQSENYESMEGSILKDEDRKKAISYLNESLQQVSPKRTDASEDSIIKKSFSLDETLIPNLFQSNFNKQPTDAKSVGIQDNLEKISSFVKQGSSTYSQQNVSHKASIDNMPTSSEKIPSNLVKQASSTYSQHSLSHKPSIDNIPTNSDEVTVIKPKRINSWTDPDRDSRNSIPTEPNQIVEEIKVAEPRVKPALPPRTEKQQPQEIEDLLQLHRFAFDKDKKKEEKLAQGLWKQEDVNESETLEKSVSYEFSFEENSHEKDGQRRASGNTKQGKDSARNILKNEEVTLTKQRSDDHSNPSIQNPQKVPQKTFTKSEDRYKMDESPSQQMQGSLVVFKNTSTLSEDVKVDTERDIKNQINSVKPKGQRYFDQPNQSGTISQVQTTGAFAAKEEPKKNYLVEYFDVKVTYKDDQRQLMLQNFMSGKPVVAAQVPQASLARKDLFRYAK